MAKGKTQYAHSFLFNFLNVLIISACGWASQDENWNTSVKK